MFLTLKTDHYNYVINVSGTPHYSPVFENSSETVVFNEVSSNPVPLGHTLVSACSDVMTLLSWCRSLNGLWRAPLRGKKRLKFKFSTTASTSTTGTTRRASTQLQLVLQLFWGGIKFEGLRDAFESWCNELWREVVCVSPTSWSTTATSSSAAHWPLNSTTTHHQASPLHGNTSMTSLMTWRVRTGLFCRTTTSCRRIRQLRTCLVAECEWRHKWHAQLESDVIFLFRMGSMRRLVEKARRSPSRDGRRRRTASLESLPITERSRSELRQYTSVVQHEVEFEVHLYVFL